MDEFILILMETHKISRNNLYNLQYSSSGLVIKSSTSSPKFSMKADICEAVGFQKQFDKLSFLMTGGRFSASLNVKKFNMII